MNMNRKTLLFPAMILFWGLARGGEQKEMESQWRNSEIVIDGDGREWRDAVFYLEKERLGFGLKNDSTALFVLLKFDRESKRQALRFGFTLWFDSSGKNKKKFGVRFPIGMMNYGAGGAPRRRDEEGEEAFQQFGSMLREIEVFGPEKEDHNRFVAGSAFGLNAATSDSPEELVCELRIPLQVVQGQPYALSTHVGEMFSLGFEMGEFDPDKMRENVPRRGPSTFGGGPPSGRRRSSDGMPPRGFGGGRPPGFERLKGFKVWKRVMLASHGANASSGESQVDHLEHVRVSLAAHDLPLREVLQRLVSQTGLQIVYSDALVQDVRVSYAAKQVPLRTALENLLAPVALDYRVMEDGQIVIIKRAADEAKTVQ